MPATQEAADTIIAQLSCLRDGGHDQPDPPAKAMRTTEIGL